jgi:hypothetical protein
VETKARKHARQRQQKPRRSRSTRGNNKIDRYHQIPFFASKGCAVWLATSATPSLTISCVGRCPSLGNAVRQHGERPGDRAWVVCASALSRTRSRALPTERRVSPILFRSRATSRSEHTGNARTRCERNPRARSDTPRYRRRPSPQRRLTGLAPDSSALVGRLRLTEIRTSLLRATRSPVGC